MRYEVRYVFIGLFCIFIFNNAYAKTVDELVNKIANTTPTMGYVFWIAKDSNAQNKAYLSSQKQDNSRSVWFFTTQKKWQPIHNAGAFDGFPKADKVFQSVTLDKANEKITFSNIENNPADDLTSEKAKLLESKEFSIGWYFWVNSGDAFLFSKNASNEFSIWYFTTEKKWQPIHNAGAFDGFDKAEITLEDISFQASTGVLTIGKSISSENDAPQDDKPSFPTGITLTSSDLTEGAFLDETYATSISPSLSWDVSADIKNQNVIKSYAISLQDLDVSKYHWNVINIPSSITSFPKGASFNYQGSKNIPNDFGTPSYLGPFPDAGETHNYEFSVYGFVTASIGGYQDYKDAIYKSSIKVKYTGK